MRRRDAKEKSDVLKAAGIGSKAVSNAAGKNKKNIQSKHLFGCPKFYMKANP